MEHSDAVRQALEEIDIPAARAWYKLLFPHLPQPRDDAETLASIHVARTYSETIGFRHRAYSHRWCLERGLPSGLPDHMKPRAERIYPRIVEAVGISVNTPDSRRELGQAIQKAMSDAVMDCYAQGKTNPEFVKARMQEARTRVLKG